MSSNESLKAIPFMEIPETDVSSADVIELQEYRDGQRSDTTEVEITLNADFYQVEAARNDPDAFAELLKKYGNLVRYIANKYYLIGASEEDLMQEAMLGFYKGVRDYDGVSSSFKSFAVLCVKRQIISAITSANREKHKLLSNSVSLNAPLNPHYYYDDTTVSDSLPVLGDILPSSGRSPADIVEGKEAFEGLINFIPKNLSRLELSVIKLLIDGKTYTEMAEELGAEYKTIDNALQRIRRKISTYLVEQE